MDTRIDRRTFLTGAGILAATGAMGAVTGCSPKTDSGSDASATDSSGAQSSGGGSGKGGDDSGKGGSGDGGGGSKGSNKASG